MTFWVAGAIVVGGVVGAVGSNMAASKQANAQNNATNMQEGMFDTITGQEQPFMQAGYGATSDLQGLLGLTGTPGSTVGTTGLPQGYLNQQFDPNDLSTNPAYNFAVQQGGQATRNADTPGMGALSGAALKDLTNFNVGTANQYENQYFNQFQQQQQNIFARLSGIAGLGQNAASNTGTAGTQLGIGAAQATAAAGASTAGGIVGGTNALGGSANNLAGLMYLNAGQPMGEVGYGGSPANTNPSSYYAQNGSDVNSTVFSDIRLKTNLKRIAMTERGNPVYSWDWKTGGKGAGVIAQEVAHIPGAVSTDESGLLKVDLRKV